MKGQGLISDSLSSLKNLWNIAYRLFILLSSLFFLLVFVPQIFYPDWLNLAPIIAVFLLGLGELSYNLSSNKVVLDEILDKSKYLIKNLGSLFVLFLFANYWMHWISALNYEFNTFATTIEKLFSETIVLSILAIGVFLLLLFLGLKIIDWFAGYFVITESIKKYIGLAWTIIVIIYFVGNAGALLSSRAVTWIYRKLNNVIGVSLVVLHGNYLLKGIKNKLFKQLI